MMDPKGERRCRTVEGRMKGGIRERYTTPGLRGRVEVVVPDLGLEGLVVVDAGEVGEVLSGMSLLITVGFVDNSIGVLGGVVLGSSSSET